MKQAHEGIDFESLSNSNVPMFAVMKSGVSAVKFNKNDNMGTGVYITNLSYLADRYTVFYMHTKTHSTSGNLYNSSSSWCTEGWTGLDPFSISVTKCISAEFFISSVVGTIVVTISAEVDLGSCKGIGSSTKLWEMEYA